LRIIKTVTGYALFERISQRIEQEIRAALARTGIVIAI
jgi:hypothetical protein